MRRFEGTRVLVVGGGADGPPRSGERLAMGNGRAICLRLASEGASIAVTDRVLARAEETIDACSGGGPSIAIAADAASPEACVDAVRQAASVLGGIDVVIANVGIASGQSIRDQTVASWDHEIAVNLRAHWITAQAALPAMLDQGHGVFVFITSLAALRGGTGLAYEASKAGQLGVMRHLTVRYAKRGIRSNALMLGLIDSTMVRREFGAIDGRMEQRSKAPAMKRQGRPEEVAAACAFLACDDASYVNGTTLVVDGGLSA